MKLRLGRCLFAYVSIVALAVTLLSQLRRHVTLIIRLFYANPGTTTLSDTMIYSGLYGDDVLGCRRTDDMLQPY